MTDAPLLTTVMRERRLLEKDLLKSLIDSDDAVSELWDLWFFERGPKAAQELRQADELTLDRKTWPLAEQRLREMMSEYGIHWAEPTNRLATLFFLQGRLEESKELCLQVLRVKPWHFGALSGIVMVNEGLQDYRDAQYWAGLCLPPLEQMSSSDDRRRRRGWVKRAIEDANEALRQLEEQLEEWLGKSDVEDEEEEEEEDSVWQ